MPLTSNWNIWTPDDADNYDFIVDSAATAQTVDDALSDVALSANAFKGTVAERTAFTSTAVDGMLWQDTDDIKMIWRKDGAAWVPAVWRWSGTTAQMNSFGANAPDGFEWFSTTDNVEYIRLGGAWFGGVGNITTLGTGVAVTYLDLRRIAPKFAQLTLNVNRPTGGFGNTSHVLTLPSGFLPVGTWADLVTTTETAAPTATLRLDGGSGVVTSIGLSATVTNLRGAIIYPLS